MFDRCAVKAVPIASGWLTQRFICNRCRENAIAHHFSWVPLTNSQCPFCASAAPGLHTHGLHSLISLAVCKIIASGSRLCPSLAALQGEHWCSRLQQARQPDCNACARVSCCWDESTCRLTAANPSAGSGHSFGFGSPAQSWLPCWRLVHQGRQALYIHAHCLLWLQDAQVSLAAPVCC